MTVRDGRVGSTPGGADRVLEVEGLTVDLRRAHGLTRLIDGVSYSVAPGKSLAVVGESGAGKSLSARAVLGLLDSERFVVSGKIRLCGVDVLSMERKARRQYVARAASLVFQDPTRSLNPTMKVGWQIAEALRQAQSTRVPKDALQAESLKLMRDVGIADPKERFYAYPHQLSGGMRQRVVIAIALACKPLVLFCDEPTSSLDVTTQALIMDLLESVQHRLGVSIVLITHDLALATSRVDDAIVMYGGQVVEAVPAAHLFDRAAMPYTRALLEAVPGMEGSSDAGQENMPNAAEEGTATSGGCVFRARCRWAQPRCDEVPGLDELAPGHRCRCWYPLGQVGGVDVRQAAHE